MSRPVVLISCPFGQIVCNSSSCREHDVDRRARVLAISTLYETMAGAGGLPVSLSHEMHGLRAETRAKCWMIYRHPLGKCLQAPVIETTRRSTSDHSLEDRTVAGL